MGDLVKEARKAEALERDCLGSGGSEELAELLSKLADEIELLRWVLKDAQNALTKERPADEIERLEQRLDGQMMETDLRGREIERLEKYKLAAEPIMVSMEAVVEAARELDDRVLQQSAGYALRKALKELDKK